MEIKTIKTAWGEGELKHNTHVIIGDKTCVVIDAGCPLEEVRNLTSLPIEAVFITHGHFDHIEYIEEYDKIGVPIYANFKTMEFLVDRLKNAGSKTYKVKNIVPIEEGNIIEAMVGNIKCLETPGHSEDSMCYLLDNIVLFSGDTVFSVAVGRTDLYTGDTRKLIDSLNRILNLKYSTLYTGHGRTSGRQEQKTNIPRWIEHLTKYLKLELEM